MFWILLSIILIFTAVFLYKSNQQLKQKTEQQENIFQVFNKLPDTILVIDKQGDIISSKSNLSEFNFKNIFEFVEKNEEKQLFNFLNHNDSNFFEKKMKNIQGKEFECFVFKRDENEFILGIKYQSNIALYQNKIQIFEGLNEAVIGVDLDGKICYTNEKFDLDFKWNKKQLLGQNIQVLLNEDKNSFQLLKVLNNQKEKTSIPFGVEFYFKSSDYELIPISVSILNLDVDGLDFTFLILTNISEQLRLKKSLINKTEYLNAIINTTPACVKIIDKNGKLLSINNTGLDILESDKIEDIVEKCIYDLVTDDFKVHFKQFNESIINGKSDTLTFELETLKGNRKWMHTRAVPLKYGNGEIVHLAITDDITEKVEFENQLKRSEALKDSILSSISDSFFALDSNWNVTYINHQAELLFDKTKYSILGYNFWDEFPEFSLSHFYKKYLYALQQLNKVDFEYYYPKKNKWLKVKIYPSIDGFSIFITDISDEKITHTIAELERSMLHETNKGSKKLEDIIFNAFILLKSIFPIAHFSIYRLNDQKTNYLNFSTSINEFYSDDEINFLNQLKKITSKVPNAIPNIDIKLEDIYGSKNIDFNQLQLFSLFSKENEHIGVLLIHLTNTLEPDSFQFKMLKNVSSIVNDLIVEKIIEEELIKLSLIAKNTNKGVFILDVNKKITWINDAFTKMTDFTFDDVVGKNPMELLSGSNSDSQSLQFISDQIEQNQTFSINTIFHKKGGSTYWSRITGQPLYNEKGEVIQYFAIQEDTTVRKLAKIELQDSEKRYRALFHTNPQPMFIYDRDTLKFNEVNESAEKLYGYTPDEFNEMSILDIFIEDERQLFINNDDRINNRNSMLTSSEILNEVYAHYTKNGKLIYVDIVRNEIQISGKRTVLVIINDITLKIKTEKELKRSNERFSIASKAVSDIIWEWDIRHNQLYWGEGISTAFGYLNEKDVPKASNFSDFVHPDDYLTVKKDYEFRIKNKSEQFWSAEYRFKKCNGDYAIVKDQAYIIRTSKGEAVRVIGAMRDITEQRNHELEKSRLIEQTQEYERKRFSMELHDGLAQQLVVLNLYLSQLEPNEPVDEDVLNTCFDVVKASLNQTRALCYNLTPPELEKGALEALEALFERLKNLSSINLIFVSEDTITNKDFESVDIYNLYRIVQEFVNNAIKHSKGTEISCYISKVEEQILIEVMDNGVGFDRNEIKAGLGLNNIEMRAKLANIKYEFTSEKNIGSKIVIRI